MKPRMFAVAAAVAALTTAQRSSHACVDGTPWSGVLPMPVVVNETLDDDLCPNSGCGSLSELTWTIRKALNQWSMETGSRFAMEFTGTTTVARGTVIAGKLHIFANPCTGGTLGVAAWDLGRTWGKIRMCTANDAGVIHWQPDASDTATGPNYSFQNVLMSEIAHIVGLKHTQDCPGAPKSASTAFYQLDVSHLFRSDIDFLQTEFGFRDPVAHARSTSDGVTWVNGVAGPAATGLALGRYSPSNSASGTKMFVTFIDQATRTVSTSRYDTTWTMLATPTSAPSSYPSGIASSSDSNVRVQFLSVYDDTTGRNTVFEATSTTGATTWASVTALSDAASESDTTMDGVASTYDPATAQYVRVWRGGFPDGGQAIHVHEIFYKVGSHPVQRLLDPSGAPYLSSDTPSIACGQVNVVGSENCLLAWTNGRSWDRGVRWFQAPINAAGQLVPTALHSHGFVSMSTPVVAYDGDSLAPWEIVLNQTGMSTFSWRKGPTAISGFVDQKIVSDAPRAISPMLGSRLASGVPTMVSIVGHE